MKHSTQPLELAEQSQGPSHLRSARVALLKNMTERGLVRDESEFRERKYHILFSHLARRDIGGIRDFVNGLDQDDIVDGFEGPDISPTIRHFLTELYAYMHQERLVQSTNEFRAKGIEYFALLIANGRLGSLRSNLNRGQSHQERDMKRNVNQTVRETHEQLGEAVAAQVR